MTDTTHQPVELCKNGGELHTISLCNSCNCMNHTIDGKCGKCGSIKQLSTESYVTEQAKIACAAIFDRNNKLWLGKRHRDCIFLMSRFDQKFNAFEGDRQGFVNTLGSYLTRSEAAVVAFKKGQIKEKTKELYSEDLY